MITDQGGHHCIRHGGGHRRWRGERTCTVRGRGDRSPALLRAHGPQSARSRKATCCACCVLGARRRGGDNNPVNSRDAPPPRSAPPPRRAVPPARTVPRYGGMHGMAAGSGHGQCLGSRAARISVPCSASSRRCSSQAAGTGRSSPLCVRVLASCAPGPHTTLFGCFCRLGSFCCC